MHVLRLVLLSLTTFVAVGLAFTYLLAPRQRDEAPAANEAPLAAEATPVSPEQLAGARRGIEEKIAAASEYAEVLDRLRTLFPAEYQAFLATTARRFAGSGDIPSEDVLVFEAARTLRLSHGILAAKAGVPSLDHVFELQRDMLQALAVKDQHLCVDFLYGGAGEDFFRFSGENRTLVARFALAGIDAIDAGRRERIDREPPTQGDLQALEDSLRAKGLETAEIEAILDGKTTDPPLDEERLCRAGRIYLDVLAALPEPVRMRLYGLAVELMARS